VENLNVGKHKKTILKVLVSVILYVLLFSRINIQEVIDSIKLLSFVYVPVIIILLVANYVISAVRWKKLLIFENTLSITVKYLTKLYFIGAFFNNFMPTSIGGDVYKIYKLGKKISHKANAFIATFMERFTGVIALVLISYIGLYFTWDKWLLLIPDAYSGSLILDFVKFMVFIGFWIGILVGFYLLKTLSSKFSILAKIYSSLMSYRGKNDVLLWAFLTSFLVQLLAIFTQFFVFRALGQELPVSYSLLVFPIITLASFFIPSLNGIGVQDFLYVRLFQMIGVPDAVSLSASIMYHLFRMVVSLLGGVFYATEKDS
jgi:glycosyltransferase 2 family protein